MAGDWIKMRVGLNLTIEFQTIMVDLNIGEHDLFSLLYKTASYFRVYSKYGVLDMGEKAFDLCLNTDGFYSKLIEVGWMRLTENGLMLVYFCDVSSIRKTIGKKLRSEILSSGKCAYCGSVESLEIDHIIPVAKGGATEKSNLQVLCKPCNIKKGVN